MKSIKSRRLPPQSYIEITLTGRKPSCQPAQAYDFLAGCGFRHADLACFEDRTSTRILVYTRSFKRLRRVRARAGRPGLPAAFRLKYRVLAREDWFDKWQLDYQIMPLGARFTLIPVWKEGEYRARGKRIPVLMDPKGAFGSGTHPTTQIMAALMERVEGKFDSFLDLGTGTGLLSILARTLGAATVWALDHDKPSVQAARFNMKLNGLRYDRLLQGDLCGFRSREKFTLVGANVISTVLMRGKTALFGAVAKGGYLAVSGIHLYNLQEVRSKLKDKRFRCLKVLKKRGWAGLLFKRVA